MYFTEMFYNVFVEQPVGQGGHNGPAIATRAEMMSPPPPPSSAAHRYTGDTHLPTQVRGP